MLICLFLSNVALLTFVLLSRSENMLAHDVAVAISLNIAGTCRTDIELDELFETEADHFTLFVPYALTVDW
jgi:hypothetical protein